MFGHGKSRGHGKHKKETNTKKHHIRNWMHSKKKKKNEANLFAVIMSNDPSTPAQASISATSFDVLDDARLEKINMTPVMAEPTKAVVSPTVNTDADVIEEAVPIVQKILPVPEVEPRVEKNGIEMKTRKKSPDEPNDECLINCIYFAQQCCECTIV
ncbi:PREDICTED: uncharacterized protein LOC105452082 isoform X1 [Wasmannia auropunctata]|uniref:uncharacterized protein LOC105452082 isoform X1 n=1 Tax=Wasmannia auropunctata TaxID=64793 RepID=UPI0005EF5441|nr:PREDICTED: uncharacterized protein LOC105452082 isoform X1 [Wasmannia auropunctata]